MAAANPLWEAPRIHGELGKLGIEVSERTVSRFLPPRRRPPSQTWRTFLTNHLADLHGRRVAAASLLTCYTLTPPENPCWLGLAQSYGKEAVRELVKLMRQNQSLKIKAYACALLLDRGYGKPTQARTGEDGKGPVNMVLNLIEELHPNG